MSPDPTPPPSEPAPSLRPVEELQALCDAATPGPWITKNDDVIGPDGMAVAVVCDSWDGNARRFDDRDFIAAARTALPSLLARLRQRVPGRRTLRPLHVPEDVPRRLGRGGFPMTAAADYPIRVMTQVDLVAWRDGVRGAEAQSAKQAECGFVPLAFLNDGWFTWLCPGCGQFSHGRVGDEPVSGWNEPRWTVEGLPDRLTLAPSLGCPRWRDGACVGHWWARDGRLVLA